MSRKVMWRLLAGVVTAALVAAGGIALGWVGSGRSHRLRRAHAQVRRAPGHRRSDHRGPHSRAIGYGVDIQADYDRSGNPSLGANFDPDGGLAKPRWSVCSPPHVSSCKPVKSKSPFIQLGSAAPGTVFQAMATFKGHAYTERSAVWTGQVHATQPPRLHGQAVVGTRVRPERALWRGGWQAVPGYKSPLGGFSGGKGRSFESLSVEACRTASGEHCVNLTPQGKRTDFAQRPVTVPWRFTGWYLFAFDEHLSPDTVWGEPGYASPFGIPPLKVDATVGRSNPIGPIRS